MKYLFMLILTFSLKSQLKNLKYCWLLSHTVNNRLEKLNIT